MLIKVLTVECTKCHSIIEVNESEEEFDDWVNKKDDECPNCLNKIMEEI